jgi:hypothetical protein
MPPGVAVPTAAAEAVGTDVALVDPDSEFDVTVVSGDAETDKGRGLTGDWLIFTLGLESATTAFDEGDIRLATDCDFSMVAVALSPEKHEPSNDRSVSNMSSIPVVGRQFCAPSSKENILPTIVSSLEVNHCLGKILLIIRRVLAAPYRFAQVSVLQTAQH